MNRSEERMGSSFDFLAITLPGWQILHLCDFGLSKKPLESRTRNPKPPCSFPLRQPSDGFEPFGIEPPWGSAKPGRFPCALARCSPATTRSLIRSRSNFAKASMILKSSRPVRLPMSYVPYVSYEFLPG